ncbi:MAG: contractile injection system tape measure protein [Bacteroidota bacterium]
MSGQQHIIRRQVLELEFADESETEAIEQKIIALFNKAVLPMYDRFFSAYSNPDEIDQIERLELDLGEISLADLENQLINKIADALDEQLERLCGAPVYDDPDELAAQLGLSSPNGHSSTSAEAKLNGLTAFFEQHQCESTTNTATIPDTEEEDMAAKKRRDELIRFFEQQGQTSDDESVDESTEEDEWEDDELEATEPVRVEINYVRPDELNKGLIESLPDSTNDEQGENESQFRKSDLSVNELDNIVDGQEETESPLPKSDAPVGESTLQSNSNLLHYFLQTGLFPWWAKSSSKAQLEQAIRTLILQRPEALKADLQNWLTHKAMRKRLVAAFSDGYLVKLLQLFLPSGQSADVESITQLLEVLTAKPFTSERHRLVFWEELFQDVRFLEHGMTVVPETLIHAVFSQTETLEPSVAKSVVRSRLLTTIDRMFQLSKAHPDWIQLEQLTERFNNHPEADTWFSAFLAGRNNPAEQTKDILKANNIADNESIVGPPFMEDDVSSTEKKDTDSLIEILLKLQETHTAKSTTDDPLANESEHIPTVALAIDPFSESEKLYVRNAGMVLLWPFLERYFEKNSLLKESQFITKHAREQASWLLQQLVLGPGHELFEPHIPLNKVMVGLQPETPVHAPDAITEEQKLLMDELLTAVIEHVPAWKNLTVENLRKAYLQREGALSARDGQWLLQVKRETYDVLLDKLPWPIQLIRLPWLEHLLVVEW